MKTARVDHWRMACNTDNVMLTNNGPNSIRTTDSMSWAQGRLGDILLLAFVVKYRVMGRNGK